MSRALVIPVAAGAMLFACKHSEKTELLASGHTEATRLETSQSDTVTTRTEGPERVTTTVREYAEVAGGGVAPPTEGYEPPLSTGSPRATSSPPILPSHGPLVKETIRVEERGPVLTESHVAAKDAITATATTSSVSKAVHEEKSAPAGCGFGGAFLAWAVPLVLLALAWKFRALISWWPK